MKVYPLRISLTDDGRPLDITEVDRVSLICQTPSGADIEGECTITERATGKVEYLFGTNEISEAGTVEAEIKLFKNTGEMITTTRFSFLVVESLLDDETIKASSQYSLLQKALTGELRGDDGDSAYQIAVKNGFEGSLEEWLKSLCGKQGVNGESAYQAALQSGFEGTIEEWLGSLKGARGSDGQSAYQVALENGFEGSLEEWLVSLKGVKGDPGSGSSGLASLNGKVGELSLFGAGVAAITTGDNAITVTVPEADWNTLKFKPNVASMFRLGITSSDQVIYPSSSLLVIPHAKDTTGTNGNGLIMRSEHKKLVWLADNLTNPMLVSASPKAGQVLTVSAVKSTLDGKETLTYKLADLPTGEAPLVLQEMHRLLDTPASAPYAFETAEILDSVLPRKDALIDVKVWIGEDTVVPLAGILTEASTGQFFPAQYMIGGNAGAWNVIVQNISDPFHTALGELSRDTILGIQVSVKKM